MCSPASVILVSIVIILANIALAGNHIFKYWLKILESITTILTSIVTILASIFTILASIEQVIIDLWVFHSVEIFQFSCHSDFT